MQNFISDNSVIGHFNIALTVYELWCPSRIVLLPAGLQVASPPPKKIWNLIGHSWKWVHWIQFILLILNIYTCWGVRTMVKKSGLRAVATLLWMNEWNLTFLLFILDPNMYIFLKSWDQAEFNYVIFQCIQCVFIFFSMNLSKNLK